MTWKTKEEVDGLHRGRYVRKELENNQCHRLHILEKADQKWQPCMKQEKFGKRKKKSSRLI